MTVRRFFCELEGAAGGDTISLSTETQRHVRVLRLDEGSAIELFDGQGRVAVATLATLATQQDGLATIQHVQRVEPPATLGLIQALPKAKKADEIVRMATELGATDILFVRVSRSSINMDKAQGRLPRWNRIAQESSRQCERDHQPTIQLADSLSDAITRIPEHAQRLLCWARSEKGGGAESAVDNTTGRWVAVGPEGGFSDEELDLFWKTGFQPFALGPHILRVDTAAAAALALLNH